MILPKPSTLNGAVLVAELRAAGFTLADNGVRDEGNGTIVVDIDGDEDAVGAVVAAHNPPDPVPAPALEERVAQLEQQVGEIVQASTLAAIAAIEL